jgi:hypothetical protein
VITAGAVCDHSAIVVLSVQRLTLDRRKLMCDGTVTQKIEAISPLRGDQPPPNGEVKNSGARRRKNIDEKTRLVSSAS